MSNELTMVEFRRFIQENTTFADPEFLYEGANALLLYDENTDQFFITNIDQDNYNSIYEDQIVSISVEENGEIIFIDDHGDKSIVALKKKPDQATI